MDASLDQAPIEDLKLDTPDAGTSSLRLVPPQPLPLHLAGLPQDTAAIAAPSTTSGVNLEQINQYSNLPTVIWYYALGLAFPDLGKEGNLGGLLVGAEPYVGGVDDTALHIEGFYKFQLNDNISITPSLIVITAPFGNKDNDTAVVGVVWTTFTF